MNAPGSALVGVADDVLGASLGPAAELPLGTGQEARAAAAPQTGLFDLADDLLGRHLHQDLAQAGIAIAGDVMIDSLGIDNAAIDEGDADLLAGKRQVLEGGDGLEFGWLLVDQALDDLAAREGFLDDLGHVIGLHAAVEDALRVDGDGGAHRTQAATGPAGDLDAPGEAAAFDLGLQRVQDGLALDAAAVLAAADLDSHAIRLTDGLGYSTAIHISHPMHARVPRGASLAGHPTDHPLLDRLALDQVLLDETGHHVGLNVGVQDVRLAPLLDIHQGLLGAHAYAADSAHVGLDLPPAEFVLDGLQGLASPGRGAAGAGAYEDGRYRSPASPEMTLSLHRAGARDPGGI